MRKLFYTICLITTISCSVVIPQNKLSYYRNIYMIFEEDDDVLFSTNKDEVIHDTVLSIKGLEYLVLTLDSANSQKYFIIYDYAKKTLYRSELYEQERKSRFIKYDDIFIDDSKFSLISEGKTIRLCLYPINQRVKSDIKFDIKNNARYVGFQEAYYDDSILFRVELGGNNRIIRDTLFVNDEKTSIFILENSGQEGLVYLIYYNVLCNSLKCTEFIYLPNYGVYTPDSIDYFYFDESNDTITLYLKNGIKITSSNELLRYDFRKIVNYYESE